MGVLGVCRAGARRRVWLSRVKGVIGVLVVEHLELQVGRTCRIYMTYLTALAVTTTTTYRTLS